mmetsp:Transcript_27465/g.56313  ORF Transcript_27465/g.56313 Transcript_27465/m.56313 type:complete len:257 (-) Transcript_27465:772-1542(-)
MVWSRLKAECVGRCSLDSAPVPLTLVNLSTLFASVFGSALEEAWLSTEAECFECPLRSFTWLRVHATSYAAEVNRPFPIACAIRAACVPPPATPPPPPAALAPLEPLPAKLDEEEERGGARLASEAWQSRALAYRRLASDTLANRSSRLLSATCLMSRYVCLAGPMPLASILSTSETFSRKHSTTDSATKVAVYLSCPSIRPTSSTTLPGPILPTSTSNAPLPPPFLFIAPLLPPPPSPPAGFKVMTLRTVPSLTK